jgi:hypothetical protein
MNQIFRSLSLIFLLLTLFISSSGAYAEIFTSSGDHISSDDLTTVLSQANPADNQYVYFYSATCASCAKVEEWLIGFHERHPDIVIEHHDFALLETKVLLEEYRVRFNLPFPATPIIFVGNLVAL